MRSFNLCNRNQTCEHCLPNVFHNSPVVGERPNTESSQFRSSTLDVERPLITEKVLKRPRRWADCRRVLAVLHDVYFCCPILNLFTANGDCKYLPRLFALPACVNQKF